MATHLSVLLADDDDGHATLVRRNLRRGGFGGELVHLRDGQEVLDYMYRRTPWSARPELAAVVVMLDLNMPRLGGLEVLQRLKRDHLLSRIPVFVLTTSDNPVEIDQCYARGASACLVKPVDFGAFGTLVQRFAAFLLTAQMPGELPPVRTANGG